MLVACGTSKQLTASSHSEITRDIEIELDPCQNYAMLSPAKRAAGSGIHFQETTARNLAELNARAQLAKALQSCIQTATKNYSNSTTLFTADDSSGESITDQTNTVGDSEAGIAKELIKGANIVKMTKYKTTNNQFRFYVCVEYSEMAPEMAAKVADAFNEKLTPKQKEKVKFDEKEFAEEMEETFKDYKGITSNI